MSQLLIRDLPNHKRPREKLAEKGAASLSDAELLAILLRVGVKGKNVMQLAEGLLQKFPLRKLMTASLSDLQTLRGLGITKSTQIVAVGELAKRAYDQSPEQALTSPELIVNLLHEYRSRQKEYFLALYLNARHRLIKLEEISVGHLTASLVHPREVFKPALQVSAASIILAHNHPSDDPHPSQEDIILTRRLVEAAKILDVEILDHLIVCHSGWSSLKKQGVM